MGKIIHVISEDILYHDDAPVMDDKVKSDVPEVRALIRKL